MLEAFSLAWGSTGSLGRLLAIPIFLPGFQAFLWSQPTGLEMRAL